MKRMSKPYPESSNRQAERGLRQGLHSIQVPVAGKHNTILQTKPSSTRTSVN
jgi:hypothetical protein